MLYQDNKMKTKGDNCDGLGDICNGKTKICKKNTEENNCQTS